MSETQKAILSGLGGAALMALTALGLNQADVDTPLTPDPHESPAVQSPCPDGWDYEPPKIGTEIAQEPRCFKDGYMARLDPVDKKTCQTAFDSGSAARPGRGEISCADAGFPP